MLLPVIPVVIAISSVTGSATRPTRTTEQPGDSKGPS
jgi:hypothetical protein